MSGALVAAYCAFCEASQGQTASTPAAQGEFGWEDLTSADPAEQQQLAAEIAKWLPQVGRHPGYGPLSDPPSHALGRPRAKLSQNS